MGNTKEIKFGATGSEGLPAGGGFVVSNFANLCRNECSLCVNFAEAVYRQRLLHYVLFHFVCK